MRQGDAPELIVTSTAQATMTDAEIKGPGIQENYFGGSSGQHKPVQGISGASREADPASIADESEAGTAAKLRALSVVQGWWDSQVWVLKQRLQSIFDTMLGDNQKAREACGDGEYRHVSPEPGAEPLNSQEYFYQEAYEMAGRA